MGSSSKQETKVPAYIEEAGKMALERAKQIQAMGYVPYMGPEVAMLDPAVGQNVSAMASEFGLVGPSPMPTMPTVTAGGMTGYTSYPAYMAAMERLRTVRPEQYDYLSGMTRFDPITGAYNPQYDSNMPVYGGDTASNMPVYSGDDNGPVFADDVAAAQQSFFSSTGNQGFVNDDGFIDAPAPSSGSPLSGLVSGVSGAISDFREAKNNAIKGLLGVD
jgi:hypothetical protein